MNNKSNSKIRLMKNMITRTLSAWILLAENFVVTSAPAVELYVSPGGNDRNPGTKAKPFATIAHARDAVAKINDKMTEDITVYLLGGTYELSSSVVFGPADSGNNGHKVIYKAFPGETPIISGGKAIKGWSLHDKEKDIYKASVADLEFREIYVNGVRAVRARNPNRTSEITLGDYLGGADMTRKPPYQLKVNPSELSQWNNLNEVEVVMVTHWKQKRARIASFKDGLISFQSPENTSPAMYHMEQGGTPHFYENAYEFLDAEGEFYLNTKEHILYYKPRQGEVMSSVEVIAPRVQTLLDIKGSSRTELVHDIRFEGITFQYSKWTEPNRMGFTVMQSATTYTGGAEFFDKNAPVPGAVQLQNASHVEIRSCTMRRTSAHAIIAIKDVVSDCSIIGNYVSDTGAGGIYLLLENDKSTGNVINDNTIENVGMVYSTGCGILVTCTPDVTIQHNEIRNVRYTGISTGWSWNDKDTAARNQDVGFNLIHRVMELHDDGAGIYTLGKIAGMNIHDNYIHDIVRSKYSGGWSISGIYLDNGSCLKHVHDNVVENVEAAFFSGNPPNHDNIFERNYHNGPLAKKIEKGNTVKDNTAVQEANWPKEAKEIMENAGPRGVYRRPTSL
jgi:hypothetical protein